MDNQLRFKMLLPFWRASCDTLSSNGKRLFVSGLNKVIFAQHIQLKITPTSIRPFLNLARVKANRKKNDGRKFISLLTANRNNYCHWYCTLRKLILSKTTYLPWQAKDMHLLTIDTYLFLSAKQFLLESTR